jgi:hypothetical protein
LRLKCKKTKDLKEILRILQYPVVEFNKLDLNTAIEHGENENEFKRLVVDGVAVMI